MLSSALFHECGPLARWRRVAAAREESVRVGIDELLRPHEATLRLPTLRQHEDAKNNPDYFTGHLRSSGPIGRDLFPKGPCEWSQMKIRE